MPTIYFTLSQTEIIAARNNTVASVSTSNDLTPNSDSYFLVSFYDGASKISESYLSGLEGFANLFVSPILQAYCDSKTILPTLRSAVSMPLLLLTAKAEFHHIVAGVDTVYDAPDIEFNLICALVPNIYFRAAANPDFRIFYDNILNFRCLTYKPDGELLTATEPSGLSFLGSSSTTREGWETYSNFRAEYFIVFEDYTSETVFQNLAAVPYAGIRNIDVSFQLINVIKTVAKKVISFKVKIRAYDSFYSADAAVSNFRTFNLDTRHYELERTFCFLNSLGGWEFFSTHEFQKIANTTKKERFTSFSDLSSAKRINMDQVINIESKSKAVIGTGVYDRKKIAAIQEIIESPLVYLVKVDNSGTRDYFAINILSEKLASFDDSDYLDSFSFEYEFNHTETSTQDFLN
jgi:hypothetical protein